MKRSTCIDSSKDLSKRTCKASLQNRSSRACYHRPPASSWVDPAEQAADDGGHRGESLRDP